MSLGLIEYSQVFDENLWQYQLYHISFCLTILVVVMNLFISLVNDTYEHVRAKNLYVYDEELLNYTWKKIKQIANVFRSIKSKGIIIILELSLSLLFYVKFFLKNMLLMLLVLCTMPEKTSHFYNFMEFVKTE